MVIEKVHGLRATAMSLDERFTLLQKATPDRVAMRQQQQRRRNSMGSILQQNMNIDNRPIVEQVARQLQMQVKRALRQRLGVPQAGLRRFGSESNLPRLRRSNSFGNLSQQSVKNRVAWRQSNGNLSRSASFSNLTSAAWRGFRRRGGQRQLRGRFRGRGRGVGIANRMGRTQFRTQLLNRPQMARRGRGGQRGRGAQRGTTRNQQQKAVTKEELDLQLDQYMAGTKAALDLELDNYMKNAMEME